MVDRISVEDYKPGQLRDLWERQRVRYQQRDARIHLVRKLYAGDLKIPLPEQFQVMGKEYLEFGLPTKWMMALNLTTVLQEKIAKVRRDGGTNPAAEQRATQVELWGNAGIAETMDQDAAVDLLLNEGAVGCIISISGQHWEERLDYLDIVDDDTYEKMGSAERKGYTRHNGRNGYARHDGGYARLDEHGQPVPKRRYQRDRDGNAPHNGEVFDFDDRQSAKAHAQEMREFKARQFPFSVRVIPADDCIPLYGAGLKLEGLIVRSSFSRETLIKRKYSWGEGDLMIPAGNADRGHGRIVGAELTLYELYQLDEDGKPFCCYEVSDGDTGYRTTRDGKGITDLYAEYGLTRLPAFYEYGMHFARSNSEAPGEPLAIPFAWPLIGVLLMKELVACGISIKAFWSGFPGYGYKPDADMLEKHPELIIDNNAPREFSLKPMVINAIPGELQVLQSSGLGPEIGALMTILGEAEGDYGPNPVSAGGAGATGVSDRSLIDEQIRRAYAPVLKARRVLVENVAETMLEYGAKWSARSGKPIPIYADIPVQTLVGSTRRTAITKRGVVELDADVVGENYSLTAYYPREFGENLARTQQTIEAWKDHAMPWEDMRVHGFEDEAPEETRVKMILDGFYDSEEYRAEVLADALQANGDTKLADKMRLKAQGKLAPDGMPAGAYAGVPMPGQVPGMPPPGMAPPGMAPPGGMPPMGPGMAPTVDLALPNPGLSQLGGQVGAQVQADQAVAGPMPGGM